jgi:hypothetical protein
MFNALKAVKAVNPLLKELPKDIVKFQLISSYCQVTLGKILEKIDPDSVLYLEATEETEFKVGED